MVKSILESLEREDCTLSEHVAYDIMKLAQRINEEQVPFTKTEVANMLHCSTKTVDRYVRDGLLTEGRKRAGHQSLYWYGRDVNECKMKLKEKKSRRHF